jgi:hypothetical protein
MSRYVGAGNSKIVTRNQGGGNKKSGSAPTATHYFIANATGQEYFNQTGPINYTLACVNQLGGIGRARSQFRNNADGRRGLGCDIQELYRLISIINNDFVSAFNTKNQTPDITYELVIAGDSETVLDDLSKNHPDDEQAIRNMLVPGSNTIFGKLSNNKFNYLELSSNGISYEDTTQNYDPQFQSLINRANHLLKIVVPSLYTEPIIKRFGIHELAILSNIKNVPPTSKSIKTLLNEAGYGISALKSSPPLGIYIHCGSLKDPESTVNNSSCAQSLPGIIL